jgi:hypothetical protein
LLLLTGFLQRADAQQPTSTTQVPGISLNYSQVMTEMALIRSNFIPDTTGYVSCYLGIYYSTQSAPATYLDSLFGQFKLAGGMASTRLANTTTLQQDSVLLVLYNDDSTMMAGPLDTSGNSTGKQFMLNTLDSNFIADNASNVTLNVQNGIKTMAFTFDDSSRYYNCSLVYDSVSYIPKSLSYVLRGSKIGEDGQPPVDGSLVTIFFTGYSRSPFDTTGMNVYNYISIGTNGKVSIQPAYSSYSLVQTADFQASNISDNQPPQ